MEIINAQKTADNNTVTLSALKFCCFLLPNTYTYTAVNTINIERDNLCSILDIPVQRNRDGDTDRIIEARLDTVYRELLKIDDIRLMETGGGHCYEKKTSGGKTEYIFRWTTPKESTASYVVYEQIIDEPDCDDPDDQEEGFSADNSLFEPIVFFIAYLIFLCSILFLIVCFNYSDRFITFITAANRPFVMQLLIMVLLFIALFAPSLIFLHIFYYKTCRMTVREDPVCRKKEIQDPQPCLPDEKKSDI